MILSKHTPKTKYLITRKKKNAGRNNTGRITVAHQGGGNKNQYKIITFSGKFEDGLVTNFEYDANRSAYLAKICSIKDNIKNFFYILAPQNLQILDKIKNYTNPLNDLQKLKNSDNLESTKLIGSCYFLKDLSVGDMIYNIELIPDTHAQIVRAGGNFAIILKKGEFFVTIKMPSGEIRMIPNNCKAFLGSLTNDSHTKINWKKAGKSRWLNIRPTVRGVAKNPVDHPHGGNTSGGCHPVTPWAKLTKGKPTRSKKKKNALIVSFAKKK